MKKILALISALFLLLSLAACGASAPEAEDLPADAASADTADKSADGASAPGTADSSADDADEAGTEDTASDDSYHWDDITFTFTELTEDPGEWGARLNTPEGKWVIAVFQITEGMIEPGRLSDLIIDGENIRLKGYAPRTVTEQGVRIVNDKAYAMGIINVFFDVPEDESFTEADVTVSETVPPAPGETGAADEQDAAEEKAPEEKTEEKAPAAALSDVDPKELAGIYKMIEMVEGGVPSEELAEMTEYGFFIYLVLREDGTACLDMLGDRSEMTWDENGLRGDDGDVLACTYSDGVLTAQQDDANRMVFERLTEEELAAYESGEGTDLDKLLDALITKMVEEPGEVPDEEPGEEPEPEVADDDGIYHWDGMNFELSEITEDLGTRGSQLSAPKGRWVLAVFQITEGRMELDKLDSLIIGEANIRLKEHMPESMLVEDISTVGSTLYAVGEINVFFDVPEDEKVTADDIAVYGEIAPVTRSEVGTVAGISVRESSIGLPDMNALVYAPTEGVSGFFAVDGTLKAGSAINISMNRNGMLYYDLSLTLAGAKDVDAEVQVYKDGKLLASYAEKGLSLPGGDTVINARIKTGEEEVCSGEYNVQFYIGGTLIDDLTATL